MAKLILITEQHGVDESGNHWVLSHVDPPEWEKSKAFPIVPLAEAIGSDPDQDDS